MPPVTPIVSTSSVVEYITETAKDSGVSVELALYVVGHESGFDCFQVGDMNIFKKGKPIRARGCWQITEYYHPDVTDEQAFDFIWSTNWAMKYLKDKSICMGMWTTCRVYYSALK